MFMKLGKLCRIVVLLHDYPYPTTHDPQPNDRGYTGDTCITPTNNIPNDDLFCAMLKMNV